MFLDFFLRRKKVDRLQHILSYTIFIYYFSLYTRLCYLIEKLFFYPKNILCVSYKQPIFRIFFLSFAWFLQFTISLCHTLDCIVNIVCGIKWTLKNSIIFLPFYLSWKSIGAFFHACLIEARNHRLISRLFSAAAAFFLSRSLYYPPCNQTTHSICWNRRIDQKWTFAICRASPLGDKTVFQINRHSNELFKLVSECLIHDLNFTGFIIIAPKIHHR